MEDAAVEIASHVDAQRRLDELRKEKEDLISERNSFSPANLVKRRKNLAPLKSDLKKSTAYVKKLRSINAESLQQCIRDAESLNLNLYLSEIVAAILEIGFKATDVPLMVKLVMMLHSRYDGFGETFATSLKDALLAATSAPPS